jgi:hypothetical protein
MTLAEFDRMVRSRHDGGDSVRLRLKRGRWELQVAGTFVYGATLDAAVDRAVEYKILTRATGS